MQTNITLHTIKSQKIYNKTSEFLINWLRLYHNITQKALVLLSGGSAVQIYKDLVNFIDKSDLDFSFLAFAQVDERFCPEGTKQVKSSKLKAQSQEENINSYQIERSGLWKICREKNIPYYLVSQTGSLQESAEQYNKTIEKLFQEYTYKIAILGIGEDGHTAGLLSGYQKLWDKEKLIVGYENDGEFKQRISMTPKAIKQVDQAIVVATGDKKKRVIRNLLNENYKPCIDDFPASIIKSIPIVDLFYDKIIV